MASCRDHARLLRGRPVDALMIDEVNVPGRADLDAIVSEHEQAAHPFLELSHRGRHRKLRRSSALVDVEGFADEVDHCALTDPLVCFLLRESIAA